jgi:hypothetical protein
MEPKALHDARPYIELVHTRIYINSANIEIESSDGHSIFLSDIGALVQMAQQFSQQTWHAGDRSSASLYYRAKILRPTI